MVRLFHFSLLSLLPSLTDEKSGKTRRPAQYSEEVREDDEEWEYSRQSLAPLS